MLPAYTKSWLDRTNKGRVLSLASARNASWLAYSLHPRSLPPIWSWMHKTDAHPCPPIHNNIAPMPTLHPKPMGMGTQCRALLPSSSTVARGPLLNRRCCGLHSTIAQFLPCAACKHINPQILFAMEQEPQILVLAESFF